MLQVKLKNVSLERQHKLLGNYIPVYTRHNI